MFQLSVWHIFQASLFSPPSAASISHLLVNLASLQFYLYWVVQGKIYISMSGAALLVRMTTWSSTRVKQRSSGTNNSNRECAGAPEHVRYLVRLSILVYLDLFVKTLVQTVLLLPIFPKNTQKLSVGASRTTRATMRITILLP